MREFRAFAVRSSLSLRSSFFALSCLVKEALDDVKSERLAETLRETGPNNERDAHHIDEYAGIEVPHSGKHSCRLRPDSLLRRTVRFARRVGHLRTFPTQQTVRLPGVEWQRIEPPHHCMDNRLYDVPDYVKD